MPRIRTIKPEFFRHGALFDAEIETGFPLRLAFIGLWTVADREGRFAWNPRSMKHDILPYDDIDLGAVLSALEKIGCVRRYVDDDGRVYGYIPSWRRHQVINKREARSNLPDPAMHAPECTETHVHAHDQQNQEDSKKAGACTVTHMHARGEREEEKEREGKGKGTEEEKEGERESIINSESVTTRASDLPAPCMLPDIPAHLDGRPPSAARSPNGERPPSGLCKQGGQKIVDVSGSGRDDLIRSLENLERGLAESENEVTDG